MAKSKKNRQKDFGKVKLKVGKKLKKGENVTNASFRTRSVQITQHLKSDKTTGPITKKRQNIQEVFAHCRHYNANVRQEAVNGLREIVTTFPDVLNTHLSDILEKSSEHLSDRESSVRQGSLRLFKSIFPRVPEKQISPFFSMVCAHLCCAMTHINSDVQLDSLSVFDLLLDNYPSLLISKAGQVMTNFIEQISRQKGEGQRSLSTNLGQKMTSMKWRSSVLGRIEKFLMAFKDYHSHSDRLDSDTSGLVWFSDLGETGIEVFPKYIQQQWENPGFILRSLNETTDSKNSSDGKFSSFVDMLVPLLLECWIEASSQETLIGTANILTSDTVFALSSILNVTKLLWECVDCLQMEHEAVVWRSGKHMKDFQQRLMFGFPYSLQEFASSQAKRKAQDEQSAIALLNLSICEIMTQVLPDIHETSNPFPTWLGDLMLYLRDFLSLTSSGKTYVGASCRTVVLIVEKLFKSGVEGSKYSDTLSEVMNGMFTRFKKASHLSQEKKVYLKFFSDMIFDPYSSNKISDELRDKFIRCLPELLPFAAKENTSMASLLIQSMKVAACRKCLTFLDTEFFSNRGLEWFGDTNGAIVYLNEDFQRDLLSLLYFVPCIDTDMTKLFVNLVRCEKLSERNVSYFIQLLHNRFLQSSQTVQECGVYLSFIINLIMGDTGNMDTSVVNLDQDYTAGKYHLVDLEQYTKGVSMCWSRHEYLVQEACKVINMFENRSQVKGMILKFIQKYLVENSKITQHSALGICKVTSICDVMPSGISNDLVQLTLSVLITSVRSGSDVMTLNSLQSAACDYLGKDPRVFCMILSNIRARMQESSEDGLTVLLKVCVLVLKEEYRKTILTNQLALNILKHIVKDIHMKEKKSTELENLLADLEYRSSTESFTVI